MQPKKEEGANHHFLHYIYSYIYIDNDDDDDDIPIIICTHLGYNNMGYMNVFFVKSSVVLIQLTKKKDIYIQTIYVLQKPHNNNNGSVQKR